MMNRTKRLACKHMTVICDISEETNKNESWKKTIEEKLFYLKVCAS